jgi:hypothetical protein
LTEHVVKFFPETLRRLKFPAFFITGALLPDHWTSLDDLGVVDALAHAMPPGIRHQLKDHVEYQLKVNGKLSASLVKKRGLILGFVPTLKLRELPPSITSLDIYYCPVDFDILATKHLKHMNVAVAEGTLVAQRGIFSERMPLNRLETLHLLLSRMVQTHHLSRLTPSSLVELCLPNIDVTYGKMAVPLPPTLKKMTVFSIDQKSIRSLLSQSNVVYLTVVYGTKLHSAHIGALPRSLTKLRLGYSACKTCSTGDTSRMSPVSSDETFSHSNVVALPPALIQLEMGTTFGIPCREFSALPGSLKILAPRFVQVSLADLSLEGLTTLELPNMLHKLVQEAAPPNLKVSAAPNRLFISDHDTENLPDSLTALVIAGHYNNLGDPFLASLPPGLTSLQMPDQLNFTPRILSFLPPTLTRLTIVAKGFKAACFQLLPPCIQHLELLGAMGNCANASLTRSTQLHTLFLQGPSGLTNHFFTQMPPSITKISLGLADSLTADLGKFIPTSLTHLDISRCPVNIDKSLLPGSLKHFSSSKTR